MEYTKYVKGFSGVNTARLALWAALIAMAIVAGLAALGSGPS
jgi:Flp pilus assembly pilin Flp